METIVRIISNIIRGILSIPPTTPGNVNQPQVNILSVNININIIINNPPGKHI